MRELVKTVPISESLSDYIQMLHYEHDGLRNLMITINRLSDFEKDPNIYPQLKEDYIKSKQAFEIALAELVGMYCDDIPDQGNIQPYVDFLRHEVRFMVETTPKETCCNGSK